MYYRPLANQVRYYKEDAKGVETMCRIVEDIVEKEKIEMLIQLKKLGKLTDEDIAEVTGLTVDEINALAEQD